MDAHKHALRVVFLIALAGLIQGIVIWRTTMPSRDGIRFIRIAHRFSNEDFTAALRATDQHPAYPLSIVAVHRLALAVGFADRPRLWCTAAQLAAAAGLIVVPVLAYGIGLRLFYPEAALVTGVCLSVLPAIASLSGDAMSEAVYLAAYLLAVLSCLAFLTTQRAPALLIAGAGTGFAYLARPEALILPAAALLTFLLLQCLPGYRIRWSTALAGGASFLAALLLLVAPYAYVKGQVTGKHILWRALAQEVPDFDARERQLARMDPPLVAGPLGQTASANLNTTASPASPRLHLGGDLPTPLSYPAALVEFLREVTDAFNYLIAPFALVGLVVPLTPRPRRVDIFITVVLIVFAAALIQATTVGYLATRHTLSFVCLAMPCAAHGICVTASGIAAMLQRHAQKGSAAVPVGLVGRIAPSWLLRSVPKVPPWAVLTTILALACAARTSSAGRAHRVGHLAAAQWIAANTNAQDVLLDTHGWVALFSNRPSYRERSALAAFQDPKLQYVVVEADDLRDSTPFKRNLRAILDAKGNQCAVFPARSNLDSGSVVIYRLSSPIPEQEILRTSRKRPPAGDKKASTR